MTKRPEVDFSNGHFSIPFLLFKMSEDLSDWESKSGVFVFTSLKQTGDNPYLKIIYVGCTLNFSNVKYYLTESVNEHEPTHICFYPCADKPNPRKIADSLIEHYKPEVVHSGYTVKKVQ